MQCENKNKCSGKHLIQEMVTSGERREWDSESSTGRYYFLIALFLKLFHKKKKKIGVDCVILCTL